MVLRLSAVCGGPHSVCGHGAQVCGAGALAREELLTMKLVYLPCQVGNIVTEGLVWGSGHLHSANHLRDYDNGVCKNC